MERGRLKGWLSFRGEALRYGLLTKRAGFLLLVNIATIIFGGALVIFMLERDANPNMRSYFDAVYMIVITLATVGYGDVTPVTRGGRISIIVILLFGVVTLSAFITMLATRRAKKLRRRFAGLDGQITTKDHIVVCGWNPRGKYVIDRLKEELKNEHTRIVLLCDLEENPVDDDSIFFFHGDPVSEAALRRVNIAEAKTVILLADESKGSCGADADARTVLAALTIRDISPGVKMTAEVLEPENVHHVKLAGAGEILDTNSFLGNLIARSALHYGLINTVSGMVSRDADTHLYTVPISGEMLGKSRQEIADEMLEKYGARLMAITSAKGVRHEEEGYRLEEGDFLIVAAEQPPPGAHQ
ncbi:MAG: ion channel [Actinomycetota bacterium]